MKTKLKIKSKIIISLFVLILLIGIVFSAGETGTPAGSTSSSSIINVGDESKPIGDLVGGGLDSSSILVKLVNFVKKNNGNTLISFLQGGNAVINGFKFENITESSSIELDSSGEIEFADLTASKDTSFNFKGVGEYKLMKGQRIKYEDGKLSEISGKSGDSIRFKPELLDESGKNIGKLMNIKMIGDSLIIGEDANKNIIMNGNFNLGNDKIMGAGEGIGKITVSKDGKISEIWKGTDATVDNVNFKVYGNNLKMYSDKSFNPANHKGENYFTYGDGKIYTGGDGFAFDLTKSNAFGNMKTAKAVEGIGTKTRNLEFTLNGGNLQISKDTLNKADLGFNIKSDGKFTINNGRDLISSDGSDIFVKANADKEGLLYSYDLNFNNGQYKLESNVFTNKDGTALVNTNTPWENEVYIARNIDSKQAKDLRTQMEKEGKMIYVDDPNFLTWIKGESGEALMKRIYTSSETVSNNKYGTEVSFLDVYNAMKSEGLGNTNGPLPLFARFSQDPNELMFPVDFGLTTLPKNPNILISKGFLPENFKFVDNPYGGGKQVEAKDAFTLFAGMLAYKKSLFLNDFKEFYGDEKLTHDEETYWMTYYFNAGEANGIKALKDRDKNYVKVWEGGRPEKALKGNPQFNARLRNDFEAYLKELGLFTYPV